MKLKTIPDGSYAAARSFLESFAEAVAQILDIICPRILFFKDGEGYTGIAAEDIIGIELTGGNFFEIINAMTATAHEMRHIYQYQNGFLKNSDNGIYYGSPAEVDAEAFADKLMEWLCGTSAVEVFLQNPLNVKQEEYKEALLIMEYKETLDIDFKSLHPFRKWVRKNLSDNTS